MMLPHWLPVPTEAVIKFLRGQSRVCIINNSSAVGIHKHYLQNHSNLYYTIIAYVFMSFICIFQSLNVINIL
jgi:hypothetical protein